MKSFKMPVGVMLSLCMVMICPDIIRAGSWDTGAAGILGTMDKVGIGTYSPGVGLALKQNSGGNAWFVNRYVTDSLGRTGYGEIGTYGYADGSTRLWMGNNLESTPAHSPSYYFLPAQSDDAFASWLTIWDSTNDRYEISRIAPNGGNNRQTLFIMNSSGNVGIGTTAFLTDKIVLPNNAFLGGNNSWGTGTRKIIGFNSINQISIAPEGQDTVFPGGGFVGIGTTNPQALLDVSGSVWAKEIKVTTTAEINDLRVVGSLAANELKVSTSSWSDFVFEDGYTLPSLIEVESFVRKNKHLPDVPSAEQISKDGLSMADMMARQMRKIEELTLYVIELKKENASLTDRVAKMNELEQRIAVMEKGH